MKKFALLLGLALLSACGGSGGGTTAGNAVPGGSSSLHVSITEPMAKYFSETTSGSQTWKRVIVTNPNLNAGGKFFQKYLDFNTASAPAISFTLPYASGYVIEVLNYTKPTSVLTNYSSLSGQAPGTQIGTPTVTTTVPYAMTAYASKSFDFLQTSPTNISLQMKSLATRAPSITYPTTIASSLTNQPYSVAGFINMSAAWKTDSWGLKQGQSLTQATNANPTNINGPSGNFTGPFSTVDGAMTYYGIGVFYGKTSLLLRDETTGQLLESYNTFMTLTTPHSATVTVPSGSISVN